MLDHIVLPFLQLWNFDHVFQHNNGRCHVARVCQDSEPKSHPCSSVAGIIIGSVANWTFVFATVNIHLKHYRSILVHEWNNIPQVFVQWLIGSLVLRVWDAKLSLLREVVTHAITCVSILIKLCHYSILFQVYDILWNENTPVETRDFKLR